MNIELAQECQDVLTARADFYRLLSSVFYRELDDNDIVQWASLKVDPESENDDLISGFKALSRCMALRGPDARTDFATDYARVFLAAGIFEGDAACPYESVYTSEDGLVMQDARDEVVAAMRSEGIKITEDVHEPEDHISFELEFMARLSEATREKLGSRDSRECERLIAVQEEFIHAHLLNWIDAWGERIETLARFPFYPAVFRVTRGFLVEDVALLRELAGLMTLDEAA